MTKDFLPFWYTIYVPSVLLLLTFFTLPRLFTYINFIPIYFIFKSVGPFIIPETTAPSLIIFILSHFIQSKVDKKNIGLISHSEGGIIEYLYFFWLGILSLFYADLYFLIYSLVTILCYIYFSQENISINIKDILKNIFKNKTKLLGASLMTVILFIFFPRFHNFLPKSNFIPKGKIGYSKTIDNTSTTDLSLSSQIAFYAELDKEIPTSRLYWRGRIHDWTDGYNWKRSQNTNIRKWSYQNITKKQIRYSIKYEQDFDKDLILLNSPIDIIDSNLAYYHTKETNTFSSYAKNKKSTITAVSTDENLVLYNYSTTILNKYLQLPDFITKSIKDINENIKDDDPIKLIKNFKKYLQVENFSYTLSPGYLPTMKDFLTLKKGYCTHFASFLGVILRMNKIPARLVSGFQGGKYNEIGNFYSVNSNDSHAWLEYYNGKSWISVDPTSFVSPFRIELGGDAFLNQGQPQVVQKNKVEPNFLIANFNLIKSYFDNLNYKVALFFDNFNRDEQKNIAKNLNIDKKYFFIIGLILFTLIIGLIMYSFRDTTTKQLHPADKVLLRLNKKLKRYKVELKYNDTIEMMEIKINNSTIANNTKTELMDIISNYARAKYSQEKSIEFFLNSVKELNI